MKRFLIFTTCLALIAALAGCGRSDTSQSTTTTGTSAGNTTAAPNTGTGTTGSGVGDALEGVIDSVTDPSKLPFDENASLMVGGKLYRLTGETLRADEVGTQLMKISGVVLGTPAADGEGFGLEKDTTVYAIRNDTTGDTVAVEVGGMYYRAVLHENESTVTPGTTAASTATTKGNVSPNARKR